MKRLRIILSILRAKKYYIVIEKNEETFNRHCHNISTENAVNIIGDLSTLLNDTLQSEINLKEAEQIINQQ